MLPCAVQASDTQPVVLLGLGHCFDIGNSGDKGVGTTNLHIGSIPSCSSCGDISKGPRSDTGHGLVVVQRIEVVFTIGTRVAVTRKLIVEIVGEHLDIGLTGKIVVLGKLIIGFSV